MDSQRIGTHQATYDAVFQHPVSRNLQWRELRAMLDALSDSVEEHADTVKFTRNGQSLVLRPPRRKDFSDVQDLMRVRHFLEGSASPASPQPAAEGLHLLVVIDHRAARIYRSERRGTVPDRLVPLDRSGERRHLHNVDNDANGQRKPELKSYYEAIATSLAGAQKILLIGSSTGSSSAMDHLRAELETHHPAIARRVIGAKVMDEQHMTEDQLLAAARAFYASAES